MYPFTELGRGTKAYWKGVRWLQRHPIYLLFLLIPSFLGLLGVVVAGYFFLKYHAVLLSYFLFEPGQSWLWVILYYLALLFFHISAFVAILLLGLTVSNVIAAPIYETISQAIEKEYFPGSTDELSFWQSFKLVPEELKKMLLIGFLSLVFFVVPGLNLLALVAASFLVAWDFYDYPLARRGMKLGQRIQLARGDAFAILGMSVWFLIPIVQIVLVPMAVVGGTILGLEKLAKPKT